MFGAISNINSICALNKNHHFRSFFSFIMNKNVSWQKITWERMWTITAYLVSLCIYFQVCVRSYHYIILRIEIEHCWCTDIQYSSCIVVLIRIYAKYNEHLYFYSWRHNSKTTTAANYNNRGWNPFLTCTQYRNKIHNAAQPSKLSISYTCSFSQYNMTKCLL